MLMSRRKQTGFTIVELLIVVVVIAILAAISIVAYTNIRQRAVVSTMSNDLSNAARAFELYKVDNNNTYPYDIPASVKTSDKVTLSATSAPQGTFCINAYHQTDTSLKVSWDSRGGLQKDRLCDGAAIRSAVGGSVPTAARNTNIAPGFSGWTLTGTAAYNSSTGELILGANGSARSPLIRVDGPLGRILAGGDMYATVASASASLAPQGGHHISISYFDSDGTTPVQNGGGYTGNGCARPVTLNVWSSEVKECNFTGGVNVKYLTYLFQGPNGGYTSADLKIKNPLLIVTD